MDEKIEKLFLSKFQRDISENITEIISKIQSQTDELKIESQNLDIDDIIKKVNDPSYLENDSYHITENGVKFLIPTKELFKIIKEYINEDIRVLTIPYKMIDDINLLSKFKSLETLIIDDYADISIKDLEKIERHTNIKEIIAKRIVPLREEYLQNSNIISIATGSTGVNDLYECTYHKIKIKVEKNIDEQELWYLRCKINKFEEIEQIDKMIQSKNLEGLELFEIYCRDEENSDITKDMLYILIDEKKISKIEINIKDIKKLEKLLLSLINREIENTEIIVYLENKTYNGLENLVSLFKQLDIEINYQDSRTTDIEGFLGMRATIDYYKTLINNANLSPFEKMIFANDLIKSYQYNQKTRGAPEARNIPDIIKKGDIVCVGYSLFLEQLLNELDIPTTTISTTVIEKNKNYGHRRIISYINDDKYNIHGVYANDATFDSRRNNLSIVLDKDGKQKVRYIPEESDIILKNYDGLSLYQYFLIPYKDYKSVFIDEEVPTLLRKIEENDLKRENIDDENRMSNILDNDYNDRKIAIENIEELFGKNCDIERSIEIIKSSERPSLQAFKSSLIRVRIEEGYSEKEAKINVEEVIDLNKMIGKQIEKEDTIFKEDYITHRR